MVQFLQMVGAVFVAFVLLCVVGYLWIRWKLRNWTSKFSDGMEKMLQQMQLAGSGMVYVPPMTLELTPADEDDIQHPQEFELATLEVQNQGFQRGGLYELGELGGVCRALFHPERKVDAVVYDHPLLKNWVEYCAMFPDETSIAYSNVGQVSGMDAPPGRDNRQFPNEQIAALWERFRRALADRPQPQVTAETFPQRFEAAHAKEMDWRRERGGVTEEEVRRCVELAGGEFSDEHCRMVQQTWKMRIAQHIDEQLREAFAEHSKMSIAEYERKRDRLVFIHDQTSASQMLMYLKVADDVDDDEDEDEESSENQRLLRMEQRCQASSPRTVFRQMQDAGELEDDYEFVQAMTGPYSADVYVSR